MTEQEIRELKIALLQERMARIEAQSMLARQQYDMDKVELDRLLKEKNTEE